MNIILFTHFFEIKIRFFYLITSFISTILIIAVYFEDLMFLLIKPLIENGITGVNPYHFIFTEVTEAFETILFFSLGFGAILILPFMVYHLWAYVLPSFYITERKKLTQYCAFMIIFLVLSNAINYYLIIPQIWSFFMNYETNHALLSIQHETRILSSIKFLFRMIWWFILIGQFPIITYWAISMKWICWGSLKNKRRYFWVFSILFAALFSVPEIWTQFLIIFLFISLIELTLFITVLFDSYQLKKRVKYV